MPQFIFDDAPIIFDKTLAEKIGFGEAIVLQQVNYWVEYSRKTKTKFFDNRYWTYNSIKKWQESDFPFFSIQQLTRIFNNLEKKGYLIVGNFNKMARDKTKWYSVDRDKLKDLGLEFNNKGGLLFSGYPVVVDRVLSKKIGIKNAIVLQKINYLIEKNKDNNKLLIDDRYWTYKSIREWQSKDFPFFSIGTIRRIFEYLEVDLKLIDSKILNHNGMVRTKWHSINYDRLYRLGYLIEKDRENEEKSKNRCAKTINAFAQNNIMHLPKKEEAFAQNDIMHLPKMYEPLPNNISKSNTNIYNNISINQSNNNNDFVVRKTDEIDLELKKIENDIYKNINFNRLQEDYKDSAKELINIILDVWYEYLGNTNKFRKISGQDVAVSVIANRIFKINNLSMVKTIDRLRMADIKSNFNSYALSTMYNTISTASIQLENEMYKNMCSDIKTDYINKSDDILNYNWLDE